MPTLLCNTAGPCWYCRTTIQAGERINWHAMTVATHAPISGRIGSRRSYKMQHWDTRVCKRVFHAQQLATMAKEHADLIAFVRKQNVPNIAQVEVALDSEYAKKICAVRETHAAEIEQLRAIVDRHAA